MNGADALLDTLIAAGVDHCFANPGTSEMHLVQALDARSELRAVLTLFEGVATGAADGFGRMRGTPAATLLHLGAGLGNGVANLHNARRASSPVLNIVGDHARQHVAWDAPLTSDIEAIARPFSNWVRTARSPAGLAGDGADAVAAACTASPAGAGQVSTLIVPADCAWGEVEGAAPPRAAAPRPAVPAARIEACARALDADTMLLLDGPALTEAGLRSAARIAAASGARIACPTFPARIEAGPELPSIERLPYFPEAVQKTLAGLGRLVLVGAEAPVSFFAYPDTPSDLVPEGCAVQRLALAQDDVLAALDGLAEAIDAPRAPFPGAEPVRPVPAEGSLNARGCAAAIASVLPEQAIVAVDSGPGGAAAFPCAQAARHSWLNLTGGAIGMGGPVALGAALASPDRPVLALLGDGGALYTHQYLWSAAREGLPLITVVFDNRRYNILDHEYRRLGVNEVGARAASLFDLSGPDIDWPALATALGVPGREVHDAPALAQAIEAALAAGGPALIAARL